MKMKVLPLLTAILTVTLGSVPTYASDWKTLYKNYLIATKDQHLYESMVLVDLDRDGIPEFFAGSNAMSFCPTEIALTVQDGKLVKLFNKTQGLCGSGQGDTEFAANFEVGFEAFQNAKLYQNTQTKEYKWIGKDGYSRGMDFYATGIYELTLQGKEVISNRIFYSFFDNEYKDSPIIEEFEYRNQEVSKATYEKQYANYFKNLKEIPAKVLNLRVGSLRFDEKEVDKFFLEYTPIKGKSSIQTIKVNGKSYKVQGYNINNLNYFKLRDLAMIFKGTPFKFNIEVGTASSEIMLVKGEEYSSVGNELKINNTSVYKEAVSSPQTFISGYNKLGFTSYLIDNNNYVMLRDVTKFLGAQITITGNVINITK